MLNGGKDSHQARLVDQFFSDLYYSAAEHLPEDPRVFCVADTTAADFDPDDADLHEGICPIAACPVNATMPQWNPDATVLEQVSHASSDAPMAPRYLPNGRISNLFWQFRAWFAALIAVLQDRTSVLRPASSCQQDATQQQGTSQQPSWSTFWRQWHSRWKAWLRFKGASQHSQCNECWLFSLFLASNAGVQEKMHAARQWQAHLREQYHDRLIYWHLRYFSVRRIGKVLTIIIDSMDKAKVAYPQYKFRKPKCLDKWRRPRLVITAATAHGWCTEFFIAEDETTFHGGSAFCEVLTRVIQRVRDICDREGLAFPEHLVTQSDNTTAQAKTVR